MSAVRSHTLSIGIVGLPNSGKSTLFNALTASSVPAENYPFCTIDKNVGVIKIEDPRLDALKKVLNSAEVVPSAITFVDIAGLVEGASKGEGLGNTFLAHIREVDAILYVLRAFESEKITHVFDRVHPLDDLRVVRSELMLKDLETLERKRDELASKSKVGTDKKSAETLEVVTKVFNAVSNENPAYTVSLKEDEKKIISELFLLTDKPAMYVFNIRGGVHEDTVANWVNEVQDNIPVDEREFVMPVDVLAESEMTGMANEDMEEMRSLIDNYKGVQDVVRMAYRRLDLVTFYTGNEKEANSWVIQQGGTAQEAAEVIHSDLGKNFVTAEVVSVDDIIKLGSWVNAKEKGLVKTVSRDYIVQDGDYINVHAHRA